MAIAGDGLAKARRWCPEDGSVKRDLKRDFMKGMAANQMRNQATTQERRCGPTPPFGTW
jgi:hypothetical protein